MLNTLFQMFALIGMGLAWSVWSPGRLDSTMIRKVLTDTVYYVFLPALVFNVLWHAELGVASLKIAAIAAVSVLGALLLSTFICGFCRTRKPVSGAILLAASFPNATYLGYPVLKNTLGDWAGPVALQFDLYACTPLLLTLGILLAARYGGQQQRPHPLALLIRVPPLWAAVIATALNLLGLPPVAELTGLLEMMSAAVVPIMLFAIGLALKQGFGERRHSALIIPVIVIQLLLMPLAAYAGAGWLQLDHSLRTAVVLEAAMPSMALGVVICDRYGLNSGIYAAAATATTLLSIFTLPLWFAWLS